MATRTLALPRSTMSEARSVVAGIFGDAFPDVTMSNPDLVVHLTGVAAVSGSILRAAYYDEEAVQEIQESAGVHDVIKHELPVDNSVWDEARRIRFRAEHTEPAPNWVIAREKRFTNPFLAAFIAYTHHTALPADYHLLDPGLARMWGMCHVVQAADRTEAILTRQYVEARHGPLDPGLVIGKVFEPYPYPLGKTAIIEGRAIDLQEALTPIVEQSFAQPRTD